MKTSIKGLPFFCSWSGGKESSLALYRAIKERGKACFLLTMLTEDGKRSRSHGLPLDLIQKQALGLNIPLITRNTTWDNYDASFISAVLELKKKGIKAGVFGDIDIESHRQWVKKTCSFLDIKPYHPLWGKDRLAIFEELFKSGFKAVIIAIKDGILDRRLLGNTLDMDIVKKFEGIGIDISGEKGEYHTVVIDGPIFGQPIHINTKKQVLRQGYWFLDVSLVTNKS